MKIVKAYAKILNVPDRYTGIELLRFIEAQARISHRSEDAMTDVSWERLLKAIVMQKGDFSVIEHVSISVEFLVDRGITHEIVRHRLASYTQESTRFVNYDKKISPSFIYPEPGVECASCLAGNEVILNRAAEYFRYQHLISGDTGNGTDVWRPCTYNQAWLESINVSESAYKSLVTTREKFGFGWRPQEARSVFPNALASKLVMTCNPRNWRHFLLMRTSREAHPQMREVTWPLLSEFKEKIPLLFDDIEVGATQAENMKKMR